MLVKKYGNRRLYDTEASRYVTLEELAERIRQGADAHVVDARSGKDLTQATLTQIILESRGAGRLLPVPLLVQLVRMGDDALAEFLSQTMTWALEVYRQVKQGALGFPSLPGLGWPLGGTVLGRGLGAPPPWAPAAPPPPPSPPSGSDDLARLRQELEELRSEVRRRRK